MTSAGSPSALVVSVAVSSIGYRRGLIRSTRSQCRRSEGGSLKYRCATKVGLSRYYMAEQVYVLHCVQKGTQPTAKADL